MDKELFGLIVGVVGGILAFIVIGCIVGCILVGLDSISCSRTTAVLGYKSQYSVWTGCIVEKPNGEKVLLEQLRDIGEK